MEVQIQAAIGQRRPRIGTQSFFLLGAVQQIIELVGQGVARIVLEERLKWTLSMAFKADRELVLCIQGA